LQDQAASTLTWIPPILKFGWLYRCLSLFLPFSGWQSTRQPEDADENQITGYEIIQESGYEQNQDANQESEYRFKRSIG
jgi:hypothetical protein